MQFITTDKRPVRYEAVPGAWVEYVDPEKARGYGELAVYKSPEGARVSIWAAVHAYGGGPACVAELIVDGWGVSDFVEKLWRIDQSYAGVKRALIEAIEKLS